MYRSISRAKQSKSCFLFPPLSLHRLHGLCLTKTGMLKVFTKTLSFTHPYLSLSWVRRETFGNHKMSQEFRTKWQSQSTNLISKMVKKEPKGKKPWQDRGQEFWATLASKSVPWRGLGGRMEENWGDCHQIAVPRQQAFQNIPGLRVPESNNSFPSLSSQHCRTELDVEELIWDLQTPLAEKFPNSTPSPHPSSFLVGLGGLKHVYHISDRTVRWPTMLPVQKRVSSYASDLGAPG